MCGQRRVVGVVGRGHLGGVMRAIEADRGGDTLVRGKHFNPCTLHGILRYMQ